MTQDPTDFTHKPEVLSEHVERVLDWFVMEGADVDVDLEREPEVQAVLDGFQFYAGLPLCEAVIWHSSCERDHVVEVGGIAVLGSPLSADLLFDLVLPLEPEYAGGCVESGIEIEDGETADSNCVWVFKRFSAADLVSSSFDSEMRELIALTHRVSAAVLS